MAHAPAATSSLASLELLARFGARSIGLITSYAEGYQRRIIDAFAAKGFAVAGERHMGPRDNHSVGRATPEEIAELARAAVAEARPDALVFFCTNFHGAPVAAALEAEFDLPVLDSVAVGVWAAMRAAGIDTRRGKRWGRMFSLPPGRAAAPAA